MDQNSLALSNRVTTSTEHAVVMGMPSVQDKVIVEASTSALRMTYEEEGRV